MKLSPAGWVVLLVFVAVLGIGLLGNGLTGRVTGGISVTNGAVLSVIAAVFCIGLLIVAGLQQVKK